jgi:[1-hydroxy-2-(trimethylamino)ethyl]phosphonate dioxygenase
MDSANTAQTHKQVTDDVRDLFERGGDSEYGGEAVTQLEHALQAAWLAEQEGADAGLIAAALLHDIGHLVHDLPDDAPDRGIDDLHERLGAVWMENRFPPQVTEPVRLHVESKRYLCACEEGYWESLSGPSQQSLALQGGVMDESECVAFRQGLHFAAAIRLRRWDDTAKIENLETPPLEHFLQYIDRVAETAEN